MNAKKVIGTPFKKGNKAASKRGPNKITRTIKESVLNVFNELQEHPEANLKQFAIDNPKDFYNIASKLIPTEVSGNIESKISLHIVRGKPTT